MIKEKIFRSILRSERAYTCYKEHKKYHQALRIYKANIVVYNLLTEYSFICPDSHLNKTFEYIFHLEDWFSQFKNLEKTNPKLEDNFVFEKLENSIDYPIDLKNLIKPN